MENQFEIKDGALVHCTVNQPNVVIPDGIKRITRNAFKEPDSYQGVDELQRLTVPASVTVIEAEAFQYCENLRKVSILGPAEIGAEAFVSCSNLKEVYLADGVKSIGTKCFSFCDKLEYLYIPESVKHIGYDIARMNDASYRNPVFRCYAKGPGPEWDSDWNRLYNDPRFGDDRGHFHFHPTYYGVDRDGKARQGAELVHTLAVGIPHGTGVKATKSKNKAESHRIPQTKLRLWLTATIKSMVGDNEYLLDDEEREMLPRMLRDYHATIEHPLDQPWEITLDDESYQLAPELVFNVYIDRYEDHFDGTHLIIHHDMPFHKDPYSSLPVSTLTEGTTIIAEKEIQVNLTTYDVRLHIQWPQQQYQRYSRQEAFKLIEQEAQKWEYNDNDNEIDVLLAHRFWKAEEYKKYKPSELPHKLIEDLKSDKNKWSDLGQIVLQPYEFYEETHSYSSDYRDAAEAYGADCDDWTTTERRKTGHRLSYEIE